MGSPRVGSLAPLVALVAVALVVTTTSAVIHPVPPAAAQVICSPQVIAKPMAPPARDGFVPVTPVRLLDTRSDAEPGPVPAGCSAAFGLSSSLVPATASAVVLSVTATDAAEPGYVVAHPCGSPLPYASHLNLRVGDATPNLVVVPLGPIDRTVCLFTSGATDLIADVTGWFAPTGGRVHPVDPARLVDTRTALRPDGGTGPLPAGTVLEVPVAGAGPIPAGAAAVAVNVTVDQPSDAGYVTAYPCGTAPPLASNVNHLPADTRAVQALVGLGPGGRLCLFTYAEAHLVVDVSAWFDPDPPPSPEPLPFLGALTPVTPERLLDTRDGTGGRPGALGAFEERVWDPLASSRVPANAVALLVNVTATEAEAPGYVRIAPCGSGATTSSVNVVPGVEATNVALVPLPADGRVCVFSYAGTQVIVDLLGAFTLPAPYYNIAATPSVQPALATGGPDHTVRCEAGPNLISVAVAPAPGIAVGVEMRSPGRAGAGGDLTYGPAARTLTARPDDAVVITLAPRSGPPQERWIRCLPPDFPVLDVRAAGFAAPGWYLLDSTVEVSVPSNAAPFAIVTDERGVPVWYRRFARPAIDVHRQADGRLVWAEFSTPGFGTDPDAAVVVSELDGTVVQRWRPVGAPLDYHGSVETPTGNRILMAYVRRPGTVDLDALGTDDQGNDLGTAEVVYDGVLQEVRPDGSLVWEWSSKDHVDITETTVPVRFAFVDDAVDLVHLNSLQRLPNGDLLVSARHLDAVLQIRDPSIGRGSGGGEIVRRFGGVRTNVAFPGQPDPVLARPHDARLEDDSLTVFDNRTPTPARPLANARGRAVRFSISGVTATQQVSLRAPAGAVSFGLGGARWQPPGSDSAVVTWGGIATPAWGEYDATGAPLLEVAMAGGRLPYRVVKEPPDAFDRDALRATAGLA